MPGIVYFPAAVVRHSKTKPRNHNVKEEEEEERKKAEVETPEERVLRCDRFQPENVP